MKHPNKVQYCHNSFRAIGLPSILSIVFLIASFPALAAKSFAPIEWVDLIPKTDLDALLNPPKTLMSIPDGSEFDIIPADPLANAVEDAIGASQGQVSEEDQAYYAALKSTNINAGLSDKDIRLAGFIVPIEYNDNQVITEFFLVPYFGACIHVPPPPPNQIVYVKYPEGLALDALYDPFWVEGTLSTEIVENDLAMSAYSISANGVKPYAAYNQ